MFKELLNQNTRVVNEKFLKDNKDLIESIAEEILFKLKEVLVRRSQEKLLFQHTFSLNQIIENHLKEDSSPMSSSDRVAQRLILKSEIQKQITDSLIALGLTVRQINSRFADTQIIWK